MSEAVLEARGLHKRHRQGPLDVAVLHGVDLQVHSAESVAILGASGSGKSSLMHLLAGLDTPSQGSVLWAGQDLSHWGLAELGRQRNRHLGFVFQFHHLLPEFHALDNVAMPLWIRRLPQEQSQTLARQALEQVGLGSRWQHRPAELSGGERQRVALARAIVTQPQCLLADEPTGNLDSKSGSEIMQIIETLHGSGIAVLIVTHDPIIGRRARRHLTLRDGKIVELE